MAAEDATSCGILAQHDARNIRKIQDIITSVYEIWNLIGIDEEQKISRGNILWEHFLALGKDILDEENAMYEDIKERSKNYEKKISDLSVELAVPPFEAKEGTLTLIVKEEILRQELDKLSKLKHKRIKEYQELHVIESKLCEVLGMPQLSLSSQAGVPSEKDLYELQENINMMKLEQERRFEKFCTLKKELMTILEVTELTPQTSVEKKLLSTNEFSSLSHDTFKVLEELMAKAISKKADLEAEHKELMEKLSILWNRLNVDNVDREIFRSSYNDCCVSSLNAIKQEIARCDEIKCQNINQYIKGLKEELVLLWEKCFVSESEMKFPYFDEMDADENILEIFDKEVAKWKQYHKDVEHIVLKIQKRQSLWNLLEIFENKANDPNRFKNRRGNLLQEERERKRLQKELPNLENEIFLAIAEYEERHGKPFFYVGMDFREYVAKQWDSRIEQKENEKIMRQKMRSKQLENEITLGVTPAKKQFMTAPKSAPSKLLKSSVGISIYRTPNFIVAKSKLPNTVSKLKVNQRQPSQVTTVGNKSILKENSCNVKAGSSKEVDNTTYADFAASLNKTLKKSHRSTVLSSKKIVGTRTSIKRKNRNKTIRKSVSKKQSASKIVTPARGKLGMPFLI